MGFKIYTKQGDKGDTSLYGGQRLEKSHVRIEAYGTVDELNACVGLLRDHCTEEDVRAFLRTVQDRLFDCGANLATPPGKDLPVPALRESDIQELEDAIDEYDEQLPELRHFILPGGHPTISYCHLARVVCRRAERRIVALATEEAVEPMLIRYFNRLSDYLFVLARYLGFKLGVEEVKWTPRPKNAAQG